MPRKAKRTPGLILRGGVYHIDIMFHGRRIRKSTDTPDLDLAQRILSQIKLDLAAGVYFEKSEAKNHTFNDVIENYLSKYSRRYKAARTHLRDQSLADHLGGFFGGFTLAEISPRLISAYREHRHNAPRPPSPRSLNMELSLLTHSIKKACEEWQWCTQDQVPKISKEPENNLVERWLTHDEEAKLIEAASGVKGPRDVNNDWLAEIIIFAIATGLRRGEILNLKWSQVDLFRKTMTLGKISEDTVEQKNRGTDTLPLNQKAMDVLKARVRVRSIKADHVFFNRVGKPIEERNLSRSFYVAVEKAKIPKVRFHDLRHTFATRLAQSGAPTLTLQKLGRWKSIEMLERYAHHCSESLRSTVELLDLPPVATNSPQGEAVNEVQR